jgi:hypothetical protein
MLLSATSTAVGNESQMLNLPAEAITITITKEVIALCGGIFLVGIPTIYSMLVQANNFNIAGAYYTTKNNDLRLQECY